MLCRDAHDLIPLHVGDDLSPAEADELEGHLEGCALCESEYASFAGAREALLELRGFEEEAGPSLWTGVSEGLEPQAPAASRWGSWGLRSGIAAGLLAMFGLAVWQPWQGSPEDFGPAGNGGLAGGEEAPETESVPLDELRDFFDKTNGATVPQGEESGDLMAPASNRGQM